MCVMWVFGAVSAASGCSSVSHLRGSHDMPQTVDRMLEKPQQHPVLRASLVREKARLAATSARTERAFPLALAQLMLGIMLVLASGAALAGRSSWRELAIQIIVANAALAGLSHGLLAPVRAATTEAVAIELVDHQGGLDPSLGRGASIAARAKELSATELQLLFGQLAVFGMALWTLTRERTKAYFAAAVPSVEGAPEHPE
jgi:hypothetical protein